jgi:GNAT superfamily N-acetyltransferase
MSIHQTILKPTDDIWQQILNLHKEAFSDETVNLDVLIGKAIIFYYVEKTTDGSDKVVSMATKDVFSNTIRNVCTLKEYRRKGYMKKLLEHVIKLVHEKITLFATDENVEIYKKLKFDEGSFYKNSNDKINGYNKMSFEETL